VGNIVFRSEDNSIPSEGAQISNGAFTIRVAPGNYAIEIFASKRMTLPPENGGSLGETEGLRNYIEEKYNTKSELKQVISQACSLTIDLE
jgi:hypothetical protein